mmetsp:Transcript_39117/g.77127  ORF Transcript_39117/g.77127 Transcript_39117/m.77127 type:complete len:216 (+) Transcript_39117:601-1248(+)
MPKRRRLKTLGRVRGFSWEEEEGGLLLVLLLSFWSWSPSQTLLWTATTKTKTATTQFTPLAAEAAKQPFLQRRRWRRQQERWEWGLLQLSVVAVASVTKSRTTTTTTTKTVEATPALATRKAQSWHRNRPLPPFSAVVATAAAAVEVVNRRHRRRCWAWMRRRSWLGARRWALFSVCRRRRWWKPRGAMRPTSAPRRAEPLRTRTPCPRAHSHST